MAQSIDNTEELDVEVEAEAELEGAERVAIDPETRARRDAALAHVRHLRGPGAPGQGAPGAALR